MVGAYMMWQASTHACVVPYQKLYMDSPKAILALCPEVWIYVQGC